MTTSKRRLCQRALGKYLLGLAAMGLLLFLPAGSWQYWNAWLLLALLFLPMLVLGAVLLVKNPALLEKRLNSQEKEGEQRTVIAWSLLVFVAALMVAGLDFRWGWSQLPRGLVVAAAVVFELAYALYAEVMRENAYLSRTVEVQEGQKVIDSGLYGLVRHPMYLATNLLFLSLPLVLGSLPSLVIFLAYPPLIVKRIRNEEAVLARGLPGYADYQRRVKYRLLPFVW